MTTTSADLAIARFMRTLGTAAFQLARELEQGNGALPRLTLEDAGLGSLQRLVAEQLLGVDADTGLSPREITKRLNRDDEPNIRTALNRLRERAVTELVPELPTQRWRLTPPYRANQSDAA